MQANALGHWRKVLKGLPDRDLLDLRDQVVEVQKQPGWERIVAFITAGHDAVLQSLTQGATLDHATQSRQLGYIAGLAEAPTVVQAIVEAASQTEARLEKKAAVADQQAQENR